MSENNTKPKLSEALNGKYKMTGNFNPGKYIFKGKTIDLTIATAEEVDAMIVDGLGVIVPIKENAKSAVK